MAIREWRLSEETKLKILNRLRRYLGAQWRAFWMELARQVYEAEKAFKEGQVPGFETGELRRDHVIRQLKAWLAPILDKIPDQVEDILIWSAVNKVLDDTLIIVNQALDNDWVGKVEDWESQLAWPVELALGMDLDLDGHVGRPPPSTPPLASIAPALLVLALLLGLAGDSLAVGRYDRYQPAPATDTAVEKARHEEHVRVPGPPADLTDAPNQRTMHIHDSALDQPAGPVPAPRYVRYVPSPEAAARQAAQREERARVSAASTGLQRDVGIESWFGHSPARGGIDAGLGLVVRRGRFSAGGQIAANRAGICAAYRRIGVNYLWDPRDGSRELGAYFAAIAF